MSVFPSAGLQAAIYALLRADTEVATLSDGAVFDAAPPGDMPALYVILGDEDVRLRYDASGAVGQHFVTLSVIGTEPSFARTKSLAASVVDALNEAPLVLDQGSLVSLRFDRAKAARGSDGNTRRIDLRFIARIDNET